MTDARSHGSQTAEELNPSPLFNALRRGALSAIDAVEKLLPDLRRAGEKGCEKAAFAAVFAAVFPAALAIRLLPEPIKTGGRRGLDKAHRTAHRVSRSRG